jgi:hypothetical protein
VRQPLHASENQPWLGEVSLEDERDGVLDCCIGLEHVGGAFVVLVLWKLCS